jgi:hypothetical protein
MPLKIDLGGSSALPIPGGDLITLLTNHNIDSTIQFDPKTIGSLDRQISDAAATPFTGSFTFSTSPSWTIAQTVGINLSVSAGVTCSITIQKPGDTLFSYLAGTDADSLKETDVTAAADRYYVTLGLVCNLSLSAGAKWSSGSFGLSGSISNADTFTIKSGYWVPATTPLKDALAKAFAGFVLPFQAASVAGMPDGDFIDFEFVGKLQLGFGATYGFSGLFFAGLSNGEVAGTFSSRLGKAVLSAKSSYSLGAGFKANYAHTDKFRVAAVRLKNTTFDGAQLYLFRQDRNDLKTTESFGITVSAGAKFQTDASTVHSEVTKVSTQVLGADAGGILGGQLGTVIGSAVDDINNSVNSLLGKADGVSVVKLELEQSSTHENTALFVFTFDFQKGGQDAYALAMKGDYAGAVAAGAVVGTDSFTEQLYIQHAGLDFQLFHLIHFQDMTTYIQKSQVFYVDGGRTLQIRDVIGFKSVSGMVGKDREADLFFTAEAKMPQSGSITNASVKLLVIFTDTDNAAAFRETERLLASVATGGPFDSDVASYVTAHPHGKVSVSIEAGADIFADLPVDQYLPNGKPAPEPHLNDARNYEAFTSAVRTVIGTPDQYATTFVNSFAHYGDWLAFNRVTTDQQGSTKPGDRMATPTPNVADLYWPPNYPPSDHTARSLVKNYIVAGQQFMNFCASLQSLSALTDASSGATNEAFDQLLRTVIGMVRNQIPFPTYFLKAAMAALLSRTGVKLALVGDVPDPATADNLAFTFETRKAIGAGTV